MEECYAAVFANEMESANAYGQTSDDYINCEPLLFPPNNKGSLGATTSMPNQDRAAKRHKDRAYRERVKNHKIEMEFNMEALTQENKGLKDENRALEAENTRLNQACQSQGEEMDKVKHELNRLKPERNSQELLLKILSEKLASFDLNLREENQKLQNENDLLRQGMGMDNLSLQLIIQENAELKQELVKVKQENRALKVQLSAVCEKFIAENSSP